jgi:hypothetical protein
MKKNIPKSLLAISICSAFAAVGIASVPENSNNVIQKLSTVMAGACADCQPGGKSCDVSNAADGITEGSSCDDAEPGALLKSCGGEPGLTCVGSTTKSDITAAGNTDCPKATSAFRCTDTTPNTPGGYKWKVAAATCGIKDICTAENRVQNHPDCVPPKPKE